MDEPLPLLTGQGDDASDRKHLFDAVLQSNTSLNPKGFLLLMTAIASVSFVAGARVFRARRGADLSRV